MLDNLVALVCQGFVSTNSVDITPNRREYETRSNDVSGSEPTDPKTIILVKRDH